ncbi:hypothetical protein STCU_10501 [Strigomonas culicis]|uniref:Uncharacterized protein n=1 Tax=Strigomonas culicis TaxID=28005 RepID=S9TMR4_9TRYP|nr:hypothetical protein STCU_10501 [Strigomonas culicis]|eukprot:EPY17628.1 hypothetical protein STCU_10501 [Strigomonas culicis]
MNFLGDEIIKTFDANLVKIRSQPGRVQLHVNGMRLCVYNATGKYKDLATGGVPVKKPTNEIDAVDQGFKTKILNLFRKADDKDMRRDAHGVGLTGLAARTEAAKRIQYHRLHSKSFVQKLFAFIGSVEIELFTSTLDIGGAGASHPYFLHTVFQRGEGKVYLTREGCPSFDLFRTVTELTLENVDMRMAQMDSKLTESQFMRNPSLRDRAQLLFRGKESTPTDTFENPQSSELIREFGIIVNGKHKSKIHVVFYKDAPNIYAGEEVVRGKLPTTGVEILLESPEIHYGPWLEYCRFQLWQFFLPPNYRPIQPLEFELGMPRPNASFEFFVEFICKTKIVVPFKRRAPVPSPPFGIKDSNNRGYIIAEIGAGSQYIQPGFYMLPGETKQKPSSSLCQQRHHRVDQCRARQGGGAGACELAAVFLGPSR